MQRFIEILIEFSRERRPVLQFNRADFRLPWLKDRFPNAKIVHLYRHPRDQWCSTLGDTLKIPKNLMLRDFEPFDRFYLMTWGRDLLHYFPFLTMNQNSHPYELFYQIWKLSYLFGKQYSDISLKFEDLITKPAESISYIFKSLSINFGIMKEIIALIKPVQIGKWTAYAEEDWFSEIESRVDTAIKQLL